MITQAQLLAWIDAVGVQDDPTDPTRRVIYLADLEVMLGEAPNESEEACSDGPRGQAEDPSGT